MNTRFLHLVVVDSATVSAVLQIIAARVSDLWPLYQDTSAELAEEARLRFTDQQTPDDSTWPE